MKKIAIIFLLFLSFSTQSFSEQKPTIFYLSLQGTTPLSFTKQYDIRHTTACIQGIANREAPRVFISADYYGYHWPTPDAPWLDVLRSTGGLCENWNQTNLSNVYALISTFRSFIRGVIVYDPAVYSTSLVATTAAGVEDAIAVRYDTSAGSMYNYLVNDASGPHLPVLIDLVGKFTGTGTIWQTSTPSTGSKKCDAYIWAKEKYLDTGKCNPTVLAYALDSFALTIPSTTSSTWPTACYPNHWQLQSLDYPISKKGFCFELSPWGDEKPNDDPTQPTGTDLATYKKILEACNNQTNKTKMIKCVGFINWPFKYTVYGNKGSHGEVSTEWEMVKLQSAYNVYGEMDWSVANTSFYSGLMPEVFNRHYVQNPPPTYAQMVSRGLINSNGTVPSKNYILLCNTDYDQAGWTTYLLAMDRYNDAQKSYIYANWAVSPNISERATAAFDYMYRTKTANDFFMSSSSGAGYINPTMLRGTRSPAFYPSGVAIWQKHCKDYYSMFDYNISGWLLNGSAGQMTTEDSSNYAAFSGRGIGQDNYSGASPGLVANTPVLIRGGYDNPTASQLIANASGVNFAWYRYILYYPWQIKAVQDGYPSAHPGVPYAFLDIPTFYYLMRYYLGGNNNYRESWVSNTAPRVMQTSTTYNFTVTVRNDGWDSWSETNMYRLGHAFVAPGTTPGYPEYGSNRHYLPSGVTVAPGQSHTFTVSLITPSTPGNYDLFFDMVRDGQTWFFTQNNNSLRKQVVIASNVNDVDTDQDGAPDVWEIANGKLYWHPDDRDSLYPTGSVNINSGATATNTLNVTLSLSASDDSGSVAEMRISNDGSNWQPWEPYSTSKAWTLLPSDQGTKTVYVQYRDNYHNASPSYTDTIIYDTSAPTGTIVINDGNYCTNHTLASLTLSATDRYSSVQSMHFSNDNISWSEWEYFSETKEWNISSETGEKNVYAQFRDIAGNISNSYSDSISLGGLGDFNCSGEVEMGDLAILTDYWLRQDCTNITCEDTDLHEDGVINFNDFAVFSELWLTN